MVSLEKLRAPQNFTIAKWASSMCGLRLCLPMLPKPVASEKATSDFGLGVDLPR